LIQAALLGEGISCGLQLYNIRCQERLYLCIFVHLRTVHAKRRKRAFERLAAVSAVVFSPRPANVIGGFISRTNNPKISMWTNQNALFFYPQIKRYRPRRKFHGYV
jgi:hypothetical protein